MILNLGEGGDASDGAEGRGYVAKTGIVRERGKNFQGKRPRAHGKGFCDKSWVLEERKKTKKKNAMICMRGRGGGVLNIENLWGGTGKISGGNPGEGTSRGGEGGWGLR